jgi:Questin oxidase-like
LEKNRACRSLLFFTRLLRQRSYTVAYVDFFDEEVRKHNGDWEKVVQNYLYTDPEPLINGFCGGRKFS